MKKRENLWEDDDSGGETSRITHPVDQSTFVVKKKKFKKSEYLSDDEEEELSDY